MFQIVADSLHHRDQKKSSDYSKDGVRQTMYVS